MTNRSPVCGQSLDSEVAK